MLIEASFWGSLVNHSRTQEMDRAPVACDQAGRADGT